MEFNLNKQNLAKLTKLEQIVYMSHTITALEDLVKEWESFIEGEIDLEDIFAQDKITLLGAVALLKQSIAKEIKEAKVCANCEHCIVSHFIGLPNFCENTGSEIIDVETCGEFEYKEEKINESF